MLKYHMYQASSVTCDNEHENMQIQLVLCGIEIDRALHVWEKILVRGSTNAITFFSK